MMLSYRISRPNIAFDQEIHISGSKSLSNRILIIKALCEGESKIFNLSESEDTQLLKASLSDKNQSVYDLKHAGTSIRFLTAYFAVQAGTQILTGSDRLKERPIDPLVKSLIEIGADIEYLEEPGFPPVRIKEFRRQTASEISIRADISSQFISALCLIAPVLSKGLNIRIENNPVSRPYLDMTLSLMKEFGVESKSTNNSISITPQAYRDQKYTIESDWSSASYPLALVALTKGSRLKLTSFYSQSLQGDSIVKNILESFGVSFYWTESSLIAEHKEIRDHKTEFEFDFIDCPDLFQTICVMAAAKNIKLKAYGLQTLAIKESDRVLALDTELQKIGYRIINRNDTSWELSGSFDKDAFDPEFDTHMDHRMVMSLALLATQMDIIVNKPDLVDKSYPDFWHDLGSLGFRIQKIPT